MVTTKNHNHKISLGSAQFGLEYGISRSNEAISVQEILNLANKNFIRCIDTAPSYGKAEKLIGEFDKRKSWDIITKTPSFLEDDIKEKQIIKLKKSFEQSLKNLKVDNLYGLIIHHVNDLQKPGGLKLFNQIKNFREANFISKIGCSVYHDYQIDYILDNFDIDIIQLPLSIFDQRLLHSGHLNKLKKYGVEIHVRSVFLQGLLLMNLNQIPAYFNSVIGELNFFSDTADNLGISKLELALGFVNSIESIDKIVLGVHNSSQLQEIINSNKIKLSYANFSDIGIEDPNFLNPSNWNI